MSALKDRLRDYALGNTSSEEKTMNDGSGSALRNRMAEIAYSDDEKKTEPQKENNTNKGFSYGVTKDEIQSGGAWKSGNKPVFSVMDNVGAARPSSTFPAPTRWSDAEKAAEKAIADGVVTPKEKGDVIKSTRKASEGDAAVVDSYFNSFIDRIDSTAPADSVKYVNKPWDSKEAYDTDLSGLNKDINDAFPKFVNGTITDEELSVLSAKKKNFTDRATTYYPIDRKKLLGADLYGDDLLVYGGSYKKKIDETDRKIQQKQFELNNTVETPENRDYLLGLRSNIGALEAEKQGYRDKYNLAEALYNEDKYLPTLKEFEAVVNNDDFAKKSKYVKKDVTYTPLLDGSVSVSDNGAHRYNQINGDNSAKNVEANNRAIRDKGVSGGVYDESRRYEYLTDEQRGIFNYLYNTEGYDVALKYLDTLENYNDALRVQRIEAEKAEDIEYATKHPVISSIWTLGQNYSSALPETIAMMPAFLGGEIDENSSAYRGTRQVQNIRGTVEENIDSGVGKFFYRHGMSLGDNVVRMAAGGGNKALSLAPALMQSFNSTALDAKARGLSDEQAVVLGSIAAGAEYFFESKSFDALMGGDVADSGWKYLVNNWKTEAVGEVSTDVVNDVADILISQDYSKWHAEANAYKAEGFSDREAWNMVFNDKLFGYLDTAAGSLFSSGAMAAPGAVRSAYHNYKVDVDRGRNLRFPDGSVLSHDDVADYVYRIADRGGSSEAVRFAQKLKKNIDDGKQVSSYQLGHLYNLAQSTPLFSEDDTGAVEETSVSSTVGDSGVSASGNADLPSNVIETAANNAVNDTVQKISNETNTDSVSSDSVVDGVVKNIMEGGNGVDAIGFNQVAETDSDAVKAVDTVISGKGTNTDYLRIVSNQAARQKFFNTTGIRLSNNVDDSYNRIKDFADGILKVSEGKVSDEYAVPSYESIYNNEPSNENNGTALVDNTDSVNAAKLSAKKQLTDKLHAIGKSKGAKYEVLSVDWAKNGHDRTYLKLRETGADGKPKTYDYGYFDNISGEYVPNKYRDINELAKSIPVNSENKVSDSESDSVETVKTEATDDRARVYNDLISRGVIKNDDDGNYVFNQNYKYDSNKKDTNKTDFSIVVGFGGRVNGLHSETRSGTVIGGYGVNKSSDTGKYSVTHLQSGLSITSFDKQADALQFASYVNDNVDYPIMRYRFGASVDRIYPTPADDASKNAINKLKEIKDGDAFKKESNNNAVVSLPLTNKKETFVFLKSQIGKDVLVNGEKRKLVSVSSKGFKTQNGSGDVITAEIAGNTLEYTDDGFVIKYSDSAKVKYQFPDAVSVDNGEDVGYNKIDSIERSNEDVRKEAISDTGNVESQRRVGEKDSGGTRSNRERISRKIKEILQKSPVERDSEGLRKIENPRQERKETIEAFLTRADNDGFLYVISSSGDSAFAYKKIPKSEWNDNAKEASEILKSLAISFIVSENGVRYYGEGVSQSNDEAVTVKILGVPTVFISSNAFEDGFDNAYHEAFHALGLFDDDMIKYHDKMIDIISNDVDVECEAFEKFVSKIIELYSYKVKDVSIEELSTEVLEEFYAWYIGTIKATKNEHNINMLAYIKQFSDVDNIKTQIDAEFEKIKSGVNKGISEVKHNGNVKSYQISSYIMQKLTNGEKISSKELFSEAERAYGGTMADGVFTSKDAYDAMELGVNRYLLAQNDLSLEKVQKVLDLLPTQTNRTDSQVALQQFSTPPTLAYLANYAANVRPGETMLEPSAGIGGIALFAKHDGAKVYVNEYDKRRLGVLKNMPFDGFFNEDAEQLDNILGDKVNPSVIVMNPPFSSSEKRGMKGTDIGAKHISEALKVLADDGRLVAIVGQGMNDSAPAFRSWWKDIKEKYNVRANISIDGKLYKKYGTNFGIQMLVIDKTGKTDNTITGSVDNLEELEKILGGIRDARPETNNTDSGSRKQNSGTASRSEAVEGSKLGLRRDTEASDDRNVSSAGGDTDAVGVQTGRTGRTDNKSVGTAETSSGENAGVQSDRRISDKRQDESRDGDRRSSPEGNTTDDEGSQSRTVGNDNGLRDDTGPLESDVGQSVQPVNERSESSRIKKTKKTELTDSIYEEYVPSKLPFKNAKKHPSKISESAAMSAIPSPVITYKPNLGDRVINDGVLSDVQLEAVCYAGQSHEQILADGSRRGFFIGDGTGVGKGRTISGILLDNFNSGRKKAIWISMNDSLAKDASRDITALFGKDDMKFNFEGGKKAEKLKDTPNGIMFLTYGKLSQKFENDDSNFNRIVEWFGKDYDGVIVFDEAHKMANAEGKKGSRGMTKPSQTALAGIALQKALPKARIVYSSATGATDVRNLAYASRLGLWGKGTPFMNGNDFISKVTSGGIAAMELIARDLKSMGLYLSRNISYDGVKYEKLQHKLTKDQKQIYNTCAKAWQTVLQNVDKALKLTESDHKGGNRGNVQSAFWSSQQRFFNQIITSFQLPSVMDDIQKQLDEGKSCVIQLTSTNEAAQNREAERIKNDPELTLEDFDVSPKEMIIGFLEKSFPVEQYETQMDDRGNVISVPVKDSSGNAVLNREAVKIRDDLIDKLGLLSIPSSPIDQLINRFGEEMVAENTGRSRRIITKDGEKVEQKLSQAKRDSDVSAFQEGKKRIIVFSEAGGTGKSYHADRSANNQQQRIHYLLEAGWKADAAVQGFGRSHRSNQAITPVFKLVTTDLRGQMRFISTIAKRLDSLGAMTKGQRQAGSQGMFDASDNLENSLANDVLSRFYRDLASNHVDDIENGLDIIGKLGITKDILDEYGRIRDTSPVLREMNKFLNRILTLEYSEQNAVFDAFAERLAEANRQAEENGTAERGLENYRADSITIKQSEVIKTDEKTGAETLYYNLTVKNKIKPKLFDDINTSDKNFLGFYKNKNSGAVKAAYRTSDVTDAQGRVLHRYRLENPASSKEYVDMYRFYNWEKIDEVKARSEWNEALKNLPEFKESKLHLISGVILPVWDKLPTDSPRIYRVLTDNGEMLIGRSVSESKIDEVLRRLGKNRTSDTYTSEQLTKELDSGNSIILENGMIIKRRRVAGEWRYEISFGSSGSVSLLDDLKQKGVFSERVGGYVPRYFIPVNNIGTILDYITGEISPVSRITEGDDINKRASEYVSERKDFSDAAVNSSVAKTSYETYSYKSLTSKKDMVITELDFDNVYNDEGKLDRALVTSKGIENVRSKNNQKNTDSNSFVYVPDIERDVLVTKDSLRHGLSRNAEATAIVTAKIGDILENAIRVNELVPRKNTSGGYILLGMAKDQNNNYYPTRVVVNKYSEVDEVEVLDVLYAVNAKKKSQSSNEAGFADKSAPLIKGSSTENQSSIEAELPANAVPPIKGFSVISISDLLEVVKDYFSDVLTDDVLNNLGIVRKNSSLSNDLKFRQKDDSVQKTEAAERSPEEWSASRDEENKADVKSISDIIQDIRDRFDIPINTGNYRGSHLGQFGERTESIRTRLANDLPTVSHELGHYLDKSYGLSKNESISEILNFVPADVASRYSKEQLPSEAVAEFVKRYLTSRESARVDAPGFFKDFENVLDSVGQLDFIKALASDVNAYMSSDLDVRYSKSIETARESKRKTRGSIAERVIEKAQSVYRTMVDDKADIKSALKSAGEYDESKGTDNAYILATNAANAYQRANSNLTFALSDLHGNIIGKSLVERIMPVQKEIGVFNEYLKLKHALEWRRPNSKDMRAKQVFADPILDDPANIENQIKKFEAKYPHFKEVSEDVYDFIDNIMYEYGVKSGLESEEVYDHLKKIYPHYVPFYRAAAKNGKAKGSFANQHSNFGYAKGSGLDTLPPLDNIVTLVNKVVASSVRNQAMNALAVVADTAEGFGNVMERVSPDMIRQTFDVTVQKSSLIDTLIENTNVDYNTLSDAINGVFDDTLNKFIPVAKGSKGIVTVRRGGANLYYQINDKDLYNAVASLSPTELKGFVKAASKINNFLKMGYTQYNPLFIVSNILRDFGTAWYNTDRNNFVTYVGCYFQALKEGITQSDDFKRYMAMGGGRSSELNAEKKDLNKTFEKLMKAKNRNPVIKVFATVFNPSALNNLIEVTPRFMEFKHQLNKTGDANTAMFKADDITTNFKRHGTNRSVNAVFMFSNAQIQGLDRLYRSFKDATPKQRTARIIKYCATALILEALLAWWNMKDDEEKESYENLSDYIKNNNYVVSVGNGRYIKIPKPREHAVLSSAVGRLAEYMFNGTEFDVVDFGGYIFDNLAPAFVPSDFSSPEAMLHSVLSNTFFGGIADVGFNLDYKSDPIVSAYDKYKDDRDQYSGGTSKVAVALGNALDYSPKKINYLIENYTGWFGSVLSSLAPMDESYKDPTLGFKGRYISDSRYSTDVFNDMYDNVSAAEKRVTDEERFADNHKASADAYAENETMQLLGDFTTQFRSSVRNMLATEEEKRDAYFFSQQYIKGYDYTESEGLKFAKSLFEATGDKSVFITEMPITYDDEYSKDKVKYGMNLTPEQYVKLTNEYYDGIEKIRVDLSKLNISPERKVEEFAKRKREFTTNLRRKYVDEYGSRISE